MRCLSQWDYGATRSGTRASPQTLNSPCIQELLLSGLFSFFRGENLANPAVRGHHAGKAYDGAGQEHSLHDLGRRGP